MATMTAHEVLRELRRLPALLTVEGERLIIDALQGSLTPELHALVKAHKAELLAVLTAPEPNFLSDTPCSICGSRERWEWLDGRAPCRVCLVLDVAPLTLVRQGWPLDQKEAPDHG